MRIYFSMRIDLSILKWWNLKSCSRNCISTIARLPLNFSKFFSYILTIKKWNNNHIMWQILSKLPDRQRQNPNKKNKNKNKITIAVQNSNSNIIKTNLHHRRTTTTMKIKYSSIPFLPSISQMQSFISNTFNIQMYPNSTKFILVSKIILLFESEAEK